MQTLQKGYYKHFKGHVYKLIGVGYDSETCEKLVIYQGEYEDEEFGKNPIWVRPIKEFQETVEVNGEQVPRFLYLGNKSSLTG